jgi:hypothetical protein
MNWKNKYKLIRWLQKPSKVEPSPTPSQVAMKAAILIDKLLESKTPRLELYINMEEFKCLEK